jgi:Antitoxin Phd_YefM, type II toxin-antitoxin system
MEIYTYSKARQNLSRLLDLALKTGEVKIRRRDGTSFVIKPERDKQAKSPFDVKGIQVKGISRSDILRSIKEGRKTY